jgi:ADP-ribosylglycohydrolase
MTGALTGDIVGSIYEWENIRSTDFPLFLDHCFFTDDTILTVALADAILTGVPYAEKLHEYFRLYPNAGYGKHFRKWASLSRISSGYNSCGNGAGMRISPAGWAYNTLEETMKKAEEFTACTHNHPEGIKGGVSVASAIFLGRNGFSKEYIKKFIEDTFGYDLTRSCDQIRPTYTFDGTAQGTNPQAITAFLESTDFESSIRLAISLGGDSDTLACITGSIAEAFYGRLPVDIEEKTLSYLDDRLLKILKKFEEKYI